MGIHYPQAKLDALRGAYSIVCDIKHEILSGKPSGAVIDKALDRILDQASSLEKGMNNEC